MRKHANHGIYESYGSEVTISKYSVNVTIIGEYEPNISFSRQKFKKGMRPKTINPRQICNIAAFSKLKYQPYLRNIKKGPLRLPSEIDFRNL